MAKSASFAVVQICSMFVVCLRDELTCLILLKGNGCLVCYFDVLVLSAILGSFFHRLKTCHLSVVSASNGHCTFQSMALSLSPFNRRCERNEFKRRTDED